MDLSRSVFTEHAVRQMTRRGIGEMEVRAVLRDPEDLHVVREGRVVVQSLSGKYLLRVFVDVDMDHPEVVTSYRTAKIEKYRRQL